MELARTVAVILLLSSLANSQDNCAAFEQIYSSIFFVDVDCTMLEVNWRKDLGGLTQQKFDLKFAATLYIRCTDLLGEVIIDEVITENGLKGEKNGSIPIDIANTSAVCIAYGCHAFDNQYRITENSTCTLFQGSSSTFTPAVITSASTEETKPTIATFSSSFDSSSTTLMEFPLTPTQSKTQPETLATAITNSASPPTTSQSHVSTRTPSSAPLSPPLPQFKKSNNSLKYMWVIGLIGVLVVFLLGFTGCVFLSYYTKARKKRMKHMALHMWNLQYLEKTDLNFITLEVDQRLKKHESTTSIIECLNLPRKVNSDGKDIFDVPLKQPIRDGSLQPLETTTSIHYPEKFVLNAMELHKCPSHDLLNETISHHTISSSQSQPYLANCEFTSLRQNQDDDHSACEVDNYKSIQPPLRAEISSYYKDSFNQKKQTNITASLTDLSEDSTSIFNTEVERESDYYKDSLHQKQQRDVAASLTDTSDNSDSIFSTEVENTPDHCTSYPAPNNCVVLQFAPSSLANSNEVIYFDSLSSHSDDEQFCNEITEQNFYIDPRHFNPL